MSLQLPEASSDGAAAKAVEFEPSTGGVTEKAAEDPAVEALAFDESTGGGPLSAKPVQSPPPPPKPADLVKFSHVLNERLEGSSMVAGIVPATPAALTTRFFDAQYGIVSEDADLKAALKDTVNRLLKRPDYSGVNPENLAVALVDLSKNKLEPRYAGFNDTKNFYAASVAKVCGLLAAYQLKADVNAFLQNTDIQDIVVLKNALELLWSAQGIPPQHHPLVTRILQLDPPTVDLRKELKACFDHLSTGNQNGSTAIVLSRFPFVGSTMLAHGLYSPANKGGLWVSQDYGAINYDGQSKSLGIWPASENPHPPTIDDRNARNPTWYHNVNAVSMAQFFTLAAQGRMIDPTTSKNILDHLALVKKKGEKWETWGGCATVSEKKLPDDRIFAKCGYRSDQRVDVLHNALYYKETRSESTREFVVVILTDHAKSIVQKLFKDLIALVP